MSLTTNMEALSHVIHDKRQCTKDQQGANGDYEQQNGAPSHIGFGFRVVGCLAAKKRNNNGDCTNKNEEERGAEDVHQFAIVFPSI